MQSTVPLYHGTSTLFLDGILELGLGGRNPLKEWKVLEFAKAIYPLVVKHLSPEDDWVLMSQGFGWMVEQKSEAMNFQHGETYLSPVRSTAIRYAVNTRRGSELLSYSLDFLQELLRRKIPGIADDLYHQFPQIFGLLEVSCAPLLVKVEGATLDDLAAENGNDAKPTLDRILKTLANDPEFADTLLQQSNFRLRRSIPTTRLTIWLVSVSRWDRFSPDYSLHTLYVNRENSGALANHITDGS